MCVRLPARAPRREERQHDATANDAAANSAQACEGTGTADCDLNLELKRDGVSPDGTTGNGVRVRAAGVDPRELPLSVAPAHAS